MRVSLGFGFLFPIDSMSLLLKTISAFPLGKTTRELLVLLNSDFDPHQRAEILAELDQLLEAGLVRQDMNGKWRSLSVYRSPIRSAKDPSAETVLQAEDEHLLRAAAAQFRFIEVSQKEGEANTETGDCDLSALVRYYLSALRSDPRGAICQHRDHHTSQWQLISGNGGFAPQDDSKLQLTIKLDHLPSAFRKALLKRKDDDKTLAVGWPLHIGKEHATPKIWPVGLMRAIWSQDQDNLIIDLDGDDILVNSDWLKNASRELGWKGSKLADVFYEPEGTGLSYSDFVSRLREAAAGNFYSRKLGQSLASLVDLDQTGIHDAAALFLSIDSTFTARTVKDLTNIANWPSSKIDETALSAILGKPCPKDLNPVAAINISHLNKEQIYAVEAALAEPLTLISGPPGTGKSQTIVSIVASVLNAGGSVLFASKNHQALDAVEDRMGGLSEGTRYMVRTLDPNKDVDCSFESELKSLIETPPAFVVSVDAFAHSKLSDLSLSRSQALKCSDEEAALQVQIAEALEKIVLRQETSEDNKTTPMPAVIESPDISVGFWQRLLDWFKALFQRKKTDSAVLPQQQNWETISQLQQEIDACRTKLSAMDLSRDPVELTKHITELTNQILPKAIKSFAVLSGDDQYDLSGDYKNHELLGGDRKLPYGIARKIISHRPLWLASILGTAKRIPLYPALFDLVIFDEASQCDIASALPLFARAKRAVVVGDAKQLSFISQIGLAHDRNLMMTQGLPLGSMGRFAQSRQSLFDLTNSMATHKVMLRNQYRSAAGIVDYINEEFYGHKLRVSADLTSLKVPKGQKAGIAWSDVAAPLSPMRTNENVNEAKAILEHLERVVKDGAYAGSIGVVTPFRTQAAAIKAQIDKFGSHELIQRLNDADFKVGTVDGFQGQERDYILFSPVLGHTSATSAVTFVQKDWRRLNVAISRAKAVAHVFGDLGYARTGKVKALQTLARRATEPRQTVKEGIFDSHWERIVYDALVAAGLSPKPQFDVAGRRLDFALFAIRDGEEIKLDLEVDGRKWHQDADGHRKLSDLWRDEQLKALGWRVRRFWVDELAQDLEKCIERVKQDLS